jgi:hypothetical protein
MMLNALLTLRYLCGSGRFEPAAAGTCSLCLSGDVVVACKFHREASLPQDLSVAQSVRALFVMAQLGGRLETATGLGPTNPSASCHIIFAQHSTAQCCKFF